YIEVLDKKADEWRNYAISHACCNAIGRPTALLQKFPNKSERHFIDAQSSKEVVLKILDIGLEEIKKQNSRSHLEGPLDKYAVRSLTKSDKRKLETFLLHATISAGILLQWVQNKELETNMEIKLKSDSVCPTLAFNSWTNVINQNIMEVVEKIKLMFTEINQMDNTSSNELHNSDDESEDTTLSNNEEQISRKNLNKKSEELEDEINDESIDLNYNMDMDIDDYLYTQTHSAMDMEA
ncbi:31033_t:CDS:2, partial [Gigaspora margarita]